MHLQNNIAVYSKHFDLEEEDFKDFFKKATDVVWKSPISAPIKAAATGVGLAKKGLTAANDFVKDKTGIDIGEVGKGVIKNTIM